VSARERWMLAAGAAVVALLATVPLIVGSYHLALAISMASYALLATAWAMFSGPTRYISLATAAFFGLGAYTTAALGELLPWPAVLAVAAVIGLGVALVVGLSTLRLSGIYFVIFTFGLSELVRQLVTWYEVNIHGSVGRYVFLEITQSQIYWQLLALLALALLAGWLIRRSRLGLALRVIGEDETVARHSGIDTARAKVVLFAISAVFMTLAGAVMAPRWTYIDPAIAFNPMISFQVVIMALLGGAGALLGPILGAVPLVLLFEILTANFPNSFSILLGAAFIVIVYLLPSGVVGLLPLERAAGPAQAHWIGGALPAAAHSGDKRPSGAPLLEVEGLRKAFGGLTAVDDLTFTVERGEIVGLIGPNGSGKTTVLNLVSGGLRPDAGDIVLRGRSLAGAPPHRIAVQGVARTFQLVRVLPSMTCAENIAAALAFRALPPRGEDAAAEAQALLARVGLAGKDTLAAEQLTYIDQKRLELARALAAKPELLLLDEWLAGLNPSELVEGIALVRSLKDDGVTIVLVEHVMDAVRSLCDRCIVMNAGRQIAEGAPEVALADRHVIEAYLGEADA
jgi:branched-chain amino acid transport system permease protein